MYYPYSYGSGGGSSGYDETRAIAANPRTGDVFFGGVYVGSTFYFGYPYVGYSSLTNSDSTAGSTEVFVGRYNRATQQVTYLKAVQGSNSYEDINSIAIDINNNVYITGYFCSTTMTFNGTSATNLGAVGIGDLFLIKLDQNMNLIYLKTWGGPGWSIMMETVANSAGNALFIAGVFSDTFTIGGTSYTTDNTNDPVVFKLDSTTGSVIWLTRGTGWPGDDQFRGMAVDESAGIILCFGYFTAASFTMGGFTLSAVGTTYDGLLVRVNATNGAVLSASRWGGSGNDVVLKGAYDPTTGNTYAVGYTTSTSITFAGTTVTEDSYRRRAMAKGLFWERQ